MATRAVPVDASKADEPGVKKTSTYVDGVGNLDIYVQVTKVDDITESVTEDVRTLRFSVPEWVEPETETKEDENGKEIQVETEPGYWRVSQREIDLGEKNRTAFLKALEKYTNASRALAAGTGTQTAVKAAGTSPHDLTAIREWAKSAGHDVNVKGRVPNKIIDAYYSATGKARPDAA